MLEKRIWVISAALQNSTSKPKSTAPFREAPYHITKEVRGSSCSQGHSKNVAVSPIFSVVLFPVKFLPQDHFPNVHLVIQNLFSGKSIPDVPLTRRLNKRFPRQLAKKYL